MTRFILLIGAYKLLNILLHNEKLTSALGDKLLGTTHRLRKLINSHLSRAHTCQNLLQLGHSLTIGQLLYCNDIIC